MDLAREYDECRRQLLDMGYPESEVDEVLALMRLEDERPGDREKEEEKTKT
jgi:hypothetical protein